MTTLAPTFWTGATGETMQQVEPIKNCAISCPDWTTEPTPTPSSILTVATPGPPTNERNQTLPDWSSIATLTRSLVNAGTEGDYRYIQGRKNRSSPGILTTLVMRPATGACNR